MSKKTQTFLSLFSAGLIIVSCSRNENRTRNFEVVEEGAADGVTSAIAGPGEEIPPLTDTSIDTTTAFATLPTPPNVDPTLTSSDGSLADSLPNTTTGSTGYRYPGTYVRPRPRPPSQGTIEITAPPRTTTSTDVAPPATATSTDPTTTAPPVDATQPPPPEAKKDPDPPKEQKEDDEEEEEDEEPPADPPTPPLR